MEVRFAPEIQAELTRAAASAGKAPEEFIADTMTRILRERARFLAAVQEGIDAADRGDFIEHEEVLALIEQRFQS